jgi:hypothetical protein
MIAQGLEALYDPRVPHTVRRKISWTLAVASGIIPGVVRTVSSDCATDISSG